MYRRYNKYRYLHPTKKKQKKTRFKFYKLFLVSAHGTWSHTSGRIRISTSKNARSGTYCSAVRRGTWLVLVHALLWVVATDFPQRRTFCTCAK